MILGTPTRHGAGMAISGDLYDLQALRDTVLALVPGGPPEPDAMHEQVYALAYDLRKAVEGQRETVRVEPDIGRTLSYLSVKVIWPVLLTQIVLLRQLASGRPTSLGMQADLYRLEATTQGALESYDPGPGKAAWGWVQNCWHFPSDYVWQFLEDAAFRYVTGTRGGKARFRQLPNLLDDLRPQSVRYREFQSRLNEKAKSEGCPVQALQCLGDWPPFKW